ncbi:unnamed protein product [Choristocarpus tenellus]
MQNDRDTPSSCLFVSDLPTDVRDQKDLEALFAGCHGYENCRIRKDKNDNNVGFVDFQDMESASAARERLLGTDLRGHTIGEVNQLS